MATQERLLNIIGIDFDSIKENFIAFLQTQETFQDYDFSGSNLSVLLDILAYGIYYENVHLNSVGSELFLESARRRSSVVSRVKELGYIPFSAKSASAIVNLTGVIDPIEEIDIQSSYSYGLYEIRMDTRVGAEFYTFVPKDEVVMNLTEVVDSTLDGMKRATYTASDVEIVQGLPYTQNFNVIDDVNQRFTIENKNVDTESIFVTVKNQSGDLVDTYSQVNSVEDVINLDETSLVFWAAEDRDGYYSVYFGDGERVGNRPDVGHVVEVDYLVVDPTGVGAYKASSFNVTRAEATGSPFPQPVVSAENVRAAAAGRSAETIESIKRNAPLVRQTQGRAVTTQDYESLIKARYPRYRSVRVWGGQDNNPPVYGTVFISLVPPAGSFLTEAEKEIVSQDMKRSHSIVPVDNVVVDPEFLNIKLNATIKYDDAKLPSGGINQLRTGVLDAIDQFSEDNLEVFGEYFRYSNLITVIDAVHESIRGSLVDVQIYEYFVPLIGRSASHVLEYDNEILRYSDGGRITSNTFTYRGNENCSIKDTLAGDLIIAKGSGDSLEVIDLNVGTIDYDQGVITFSNFSVDAIDDTILRVFVIPKTNDIISRRNRVLDILRNDVTIQFVKE